MEPILVNHRRYALPGQPVVVVCLDGCAPEYLDREPGALPFVDRMRADEGTFALVQGNMPSFTNPNNVSIVTGVRPDVHGVSGNHFLEEGRQVQMTDPAHLRCPTLLRAFSDHGARVCCVTAKEKLRRLVGSGVSGLSISGEGANAAADRDPAVRALIRSAGDAPGIYSGRLSAYVLDLGLALLDGEPPDLLYLSLTDYVPHKHAPGEAGADTFFAGLDRRLAALDARGVLLGVTADHGMNAKADSNGVPRVTYLEPLLERGARNAERTEAGRPRFQVVLPITDPYVAHHGALGSFACVYVEDPADRKRAAKLLAAAEGVEAVLSRERAAAELHLPADRVGHLVVLADKHTVLGRSPEHHDLSGLDRPLRSHGGLHERTVPLMINRPVPAERLAGVGSHDLFHLLVGVA